MALGLPSVNIVFKQEGISAIQRGDRGIIALVLRDTTVTGKHTIYDISDCPSELSEENRRYVLDALKGNTNAPLRVELFILTNEEEISKALNHFEQTQFDYICSPVFTTSENEEVATWVKALRDNQGVMVKAVLANEKADHEWIINFTTDNIVTKNKPNKFFSGNSFYTTIANRISRGYFENAVTCEDVIELCNMNLLKNVN